MLLSTPIRLDTSSATPLHRQLYDALRAAILGGSLKPGTRLPATRALAETLGVSRNTVIGAFEQLYAEGYIEGRTGSGTFVSPALPDDMLHVPQQAQPQRDRERRSGLSKRGVLLAATPVSQSSGPALVQAFRPGIPALDHFPFEIWSRLMQQRWRRPPAELLTYGSPMGYQPLREAIAAYVQAARGVRCEPEQVIVVAGSQQGLDLAARVLLDPGDSVWVEDPGYLGARGALLAAGARLVPLPVDTEGLSVAAGVSACPEARMAYVTPSHQYPLGVTMSLARRLALLDWASHAGAWVLEDDYDSEYRYAGRPLLALQGLDSEHRTIYLGTFSKVLFPALRLGYLVVPHTLADAFGAARALADRHAPSIDQAVLADFMHNGHFTRHIRRTRALYAERQAILVEYATRQLAGLIDIGPAEAGMHVVGWLPEGSSDQAVSQRAAQQQVIAPPLSAYALAHMPPPALMLGYATIDEAEIKRGIEGLVRAVL